MKIKPYVILGLATVFSAGALGTVIMVSDPTSAPSGMLVLFWLALLLTIWGLVSTMLNFFHQRLAMSLGIGLVWALVGVGLAVASQQGLRSLRLSGGVILGTLLISLIIWIHSKKSNQKESISLPKKR